MKRAHLWRRMLAARRDRRWLLAPQRGLTGLETAIVLTAFVVVASVLAYTVLSAGIFSTECSKEAVHEGLRQGQSGLRLSGDVRAIGAAATEIDDADDVWAAGTNVTASLDTSDYVEGSASVAFTVADAFTTGQIGCENLSALISVVGPGVVALWIKSDVELAAGQIQLRTYLSFGCFIQQQTLSLPRIPANAWQHVSLKFNSATLSPKSLDLQATSDPGTATIKIDLVEVPATATQLQLPLRLAPSSEPIDLALTTDTDSDGLVSDESSRIHRLSVSYQDESQLMEDLAWTLTWLGKGDSDSLLEPAEYAVLTVNLRGLDILPVASTRFSVTLKPYHGAPTKLQYEIPPKVDTVMVLR